MKNLLKGCNSGGIFLLDYSLLKFKITADFIPLRYYFQSDRVNLKIEVNFATSSQVSLLCKT